jgi:hypothetical protein
MHVPSHFLTKANRNEAVVKLEALLGADRKRTKR